VILKCFYFIFLVISIKLISLKMRIQSKNQLDRNISSIQLLYRKHSDMSLTAKANMCCGLIPKTFDSPSQNQHSRLWKLEGDFSATSVDISRKRQFHQDSFQSNNISARANSTSKSQSKFQYMKAPREMHRTRQEILFYSTLSREKNKWSHDC